MDFVARVMAILVAIAALPDGLIVLAVMLFGYSMGGHTPDKDVQEMGVVLALFLGLVLGLAGVVAALFDACRSGVALLGTAAALWVGGLLFDAVMGLGTVSFMWDAVRGKGIIIPKPDAGYALFLLSPIALLALAAALLWWAQGWDGAQEVDGDALPA